MDRSTRYRFFAFAALLLLLVLAGVVSQPMLQQCCPDPPRPPGWPEPPNRFILEQLLFMDTAPRLAALAVAAGLSSLVSIAVIYAVIAKEEAREQERRPLGYLTYLRALAASFVVGVLYLYGVFVTGFFQLGWFNLFWIMGVPILVAALVGRDETERRWGGPLLIVPGFFVLVGPMLALGIDPY